MIEVITIMYFVFILVSILYVVLKIKNGSPSKTISNLIAPNSAFDFKTFGKHLAISESSDNYNPPHQNGIAFGKYQFIKSTIKQVSDELKIPVPTIEKFLNTPSLQDAFYFQYVNDILNTLGSLKNFIGNRITGKNNKISANINIYGLVAGSWLGGVGGVQKLLVSGIDRSDGITYISDYIAKFSKLMEVNV